jgi:hypothetical protein
MRSPPVSAHLPAIFACFTQLWCHSGTAAHTLTWSWKSFKACSLANSSFRSQLKLGMVVSVCTPSTLKMEARGQWLQIQPELHSQTLSQSKRRVNSNVVSCLPVISWLAYLYILSSYVLLSLLEHSQHGTKCPALPHLSDQEQGRPHCQCTAQRLPSVLDERLHEWKRCFFRYTRIMFNSSSIYST